MKRIILIIVILGVFSLLISTMFFIKHEKRISTEKEVVLPNIILKGINTSDIDLRNELEYKKPIILSFLSAECSHCKFQAEDIYNNSDLFRNVNHIVIVEMHDSLDLFLYKTKLEIGKEYKLTSANFDVIDLFDIKGFPSTLIFDSDGAFIKEIAGEMKVEKLTLKIEECLNQDL